MLSVYDSGCLSSDRNFSCYKDNNFMQTPSMVNMLQVNTCSLSTYSNMPTFYPLRSCLGRAHFLLCKASFIQREISFTSFPDFISTMLVLSEQGFSSWDAVQSLISNTEEQRLCSADKRLKQVGKALW